jgi:hypothetical protein
MANKAGEFTSQILPGFLETIGKSPGMRRVLPLGILILMATPAF